MVKIGAKRSVTEIETDEVPAKKQRVSPVDSATLSQESTAAFDSRARELCQPWDIQQFFDRIRTFTSINWFTKAESVAGMVCAQYGWICTGTNVIACQVCKNHHHFSMMTTLTQSATQKLLDGFVETIKKTGHKPRCPWRGNPCSESFLHLPHEQPLLRNIFQMNCQTFQPDENGLFTLPRLDETARGRIIAEIPESKEQGEPSDVMILSACGWKLRHDVPEPVNANAPASSSIFLECKYCRRGISLSGYEFYRTPSIAPAAFEMDEDVVEDNEDEDSKMNDILSWSSRATTGPGGGSALQQSGGNFLERSLTDDPRSLAEKLEQIGFESSASSRSQWLAVYPTRALQSSPHFVTQSDSAFGTIPFGRDSTTGSWPRNSLLVQHPPSESSNKNRRKKRRRSGTPDAPDTRVKRVRQSAEEEKTFAPPPPVQDPASLVTERRQGQKRRKPDTSDSDQDAPDTRHGKRVRLAVSSDALSEESMNVVQGSRKRKLTDRDQEEEPPPKKRRSKGPAVRTNRYFDPINEHKAPCPYISSTQVNGESVPGWVLAVRATPRNALASGV